MRKLVLLALAAGSAVTAGAASAQPGPTPAQIVRHVVPGAGMHPGVHHRRLQHGFVMHPFWFGPQFHVQNWQLYGFPPPPPRHRWVRYYDDAYMIDDEGRVRDSRSGLDWDRYGERWETRDGIPAYYGRGDWRPDEEDYAWAERHRGRDDYAGRDDDYGYDDGYGYGHEGYGPQPMPAYGGGYGHYGYGWAYPIIIETTTVTRGGCGCAADVSEVVVREPPRRHRRAAPPPRRHYEPPPPPRPGERG